MNPSDHDHDSPWRPTATLETLRARARLYATVRAFFARAGVMEVDTPVLSHAASVDRNIESLKLDGALWLQTSPEFAMKRLLAAGIGACYQIAHVFRREECGVMHENEFTLLEWYRPGFDHHRLMDETESLLVALGLPGPAFARITYASLFRDVTGIDPHRASSADLRRLLRSHGIDLATADGSLDRDAWLDLCMGSLVLPALTEAPPTFVFDFPASQAALARVRAGDPPVAERFELVWKGVELANGFHELADATEQRRRFERDCGIVPRRVRCSRRWTSACSPH
jgi:Truncated, possibly inactive, lysyl-tRNA synthetase (class II)